MPSPHKSTHKSAPTAASPRASSRFVQAFIWLTASDVRLVLLVAAVFTAIMAARVLGASHFGIDTTTIQVIASVVLFGVFLGVIVVTDGPKSYRKSGAWVRTMSGVIAGVGIGIIYSLSFEAVVLWGLSGALLGFIGMRWAQHLQF